jgi:hypothetical protein
LGAIARSLATLFVYPYIRAKVILQAKSKGGLSEKTFSSDNTSIGAILQKLVKDEGVSSLYQGLTPELTKVIKKIAFVKSI